MTRLGVCLCLLFAAMGCEDRQLDAGVGGAGVGGTGVGGSVGGTGVSGTGVGGTGVGGMAGSLGSGGTGGVASACGGIGGGDTGLLFASAGAPYKGDPCTSDGCPEMLAPSPNAYQIEVDAGNLYWADWGSIWRMSFGGAPAVFVSNVAADGHFALDAADIYWIARERRALMKMPLGGGPSTVLVESSNANRLALGFTDLYWTDWQPPCAGSVMKVAKTGGSASVVASGQNAARHIAVDATNLYWVSSPSLLKLPLAGGAPVRLVNESVWNFVVAPQVILWLKDGSYIMKMPIEGGSSVQTPASVYGPFATDGTEVFYGQVGGPLTSVSIDGGAPKVVANFQYPRGIAVDATAVYWTNGHNAVMKRARR